MIELPILINIVFILIVFGVIVWFFLASRSKTFLIVAIGWVILQSILGISNIYEDTKLIPPRILILGIFPALCLIALIFLTKKGKLFIKGINLKTLTYFHSIRIPIEIVLSLLYYYGVLSIYITIEGTNFDLFSGISAPIVALIVFRVRIKKRVLLLWNIFCLLLLLNVVITALLAIPSPFQKLAFEQPNIAVLYFPYNLLPTVIVPIVLLGHLTAIKQLTLNTNSNL